MCACRLIVHADDFGISEPVNDGILRAHREGIVTSTSIMATGSAFQRAITLSRSAAELDIGIHLTLVEEAPLSPAENIPSLVTERGRMFDHATNFMKRYLQGRINLGDVRKELDAQIERVVTQGVRVSHLDSHQHLHVLPGIRRIVFDLARKYGIRAVRVPRERLHAYMLCERAGYARVLQRAVLNAFCAIGGGWEIGGADNFVGFHFGGRLNGENLRILLDRLPRSGTCELMCHPGLPNTAERYSHWHYNWGAELSALTEPEIQDLIRRMGIRLISYRDLG